MHDGLTIEQTRPLVRRFAVEMERRFRENDHKGGDGRYATVGNALGALVENFGQLATALKHGIRDQRDVENLLNRAADVSNVVALVCLMKCEDWPTVDVQAATRDATPAVLGYLEARLDQVRELVRGFEQPVAIARLARVASAIEAVIPEGERTSVGEAASATVERAGEGGRA